MINNHGIPLVYFGIRHWHKFAKPYEFNIAVNDMSDVLKHNGTGTKRQRKMAISNSQLLTAKEV